MRKQKGAGGRVTGRHGPLSWGYGVAEGEKGRRGEGRREKAGYYFQHAHAHSQSEVVDTPAARRRLR
jgi:hypothetical protein